MAIDLEPLHMFVNGIENYIKTSIFFNSENFGKSLEDIIRVISQLENSNIYDLINLWKTPYIELHVGYITIYGERSGFGYILRTDSFSKAINKVGVGVYKFKEKKTFML